ncbi:hypothetical protein [Virgibacillus ndiopensis]|uniref:hypothetical protein n=1 Tax=Virgibacillus ndiopensis TaxID=2004408 RepID=UPI000C077570|nr:hypothetical protein [Virgibacillus ndiopensis]
MEKKLENHIAGFGTLKDMQHLEDDYYGECTDAGMTVRWRSAYDDTPSKKECDELSAELSGEVVVYKIKKPLN